MSGGHAGAAARSVRRVPAAHAAAFALGAASVAGFAPLYLFPLPIAALAALFALWHRAPSARRAATLGFAFGLGHFLVGVSWVYVSLHDFGAMPAPVAAAVTLLFCAFLALFPAAVGWLCTRAPCRPALRYSLAAPALWTVAEWVRSWLFTGFPWLALGYSQIPSSALAGLAPVLGIYGVTLATAVSAGLLFTAWRSAREQPHSERVAGIRPRWAAPAPALAALAGLWLAGVGLGAIAWTTPAGAPVQVTLLQGNVPQDLKWRPERVHATLATYRDLALASGSRLIVMPETALPLFLEQVPDEYLERLAAHARRLGGDVLIGVPERVAGGAYFNSVISLGASPAQAYRKQHLVPFGEFIPLRPLLGGVVGALAIPLQDFSRGDAAQRPLQVAGQRVAVNICYEDAFGEEIIRQLPEATLLVNVSNVAWFGRSIAPAQHLQISQARALETGRYMLRATNTGVTAIIAPDGRVAAAAPQFTRVALTREVQGHVGATPYVRWGNGGALAVTAGLLAACFWPARRAARVSPARERL